MANYSSLSGEPSPGENETEQTTLTAEERQMLIHADTDIPYHDTSLEQESDIGDASRDEWKSVPDFVDTPFRQSIELLPLPGAVSLDHTCFESNAKSTRSIEFDGEVAENHQRTSSVISLISTKPIPLSKRLSSNALCCRVWNPLWLTKPVLTSFFALFVAIFVVVLALYQYSEAHSGLL
jgi:hypothetical protein